jgi:hypothetical protein
MRCLGIYFWPNSIYGNITPYYVGVENNKFDFLMLDQALAWDSMLPTRSSTLESILELDHIYIEEKYEST